MKKKFVCLLILFVVLSAWIMPVAAEAIPRSEFDAQALDTYISGQVEKHGIQGISIAVISKTEIIYLKGYGTAGDDRPMTLQTPMYIGSQSKSFMGLAVA
jgi:CubicO group peptidase (beta-lactamase class C family)